LRFKCWERQFFGIFHVGVGKNGVARVGIAIFDFNKKIEKMGLSSVGAQSGQHVEKMTEKSESRGMV